jgi:hypothetical protein
LISKLIKYYHTSKNKFWLPVHITNTLSWIFIVLAHWNNSLQIEMSTHSDTLSWFRINQFCSFSLMLGAKQISNPQVWENVGLSPIVSNQRLWNWYLLLICLAPSIKEKEQNWLIIGLKPTFSHTWGEHTNHCTTDVVFW